MGVAYKTIKVKQGKEGRMKGMLWYEDEGLIKTQHGQTQPRHAGCWGMELEDILPLPLFHVVGPFTALVASNIIV